MTTYTQADGTEVTSYGTKETAEFIRKALKAAFPGVKFSVTTKYGSCYSATNVRWTDGPTQPEVEAVTDRFTSRGFDGMTDSTTFHSQQVNGRTVKYSGWVNVTRQLSDSLLALAARRAQALGLVGSTNAYGLVSESDAAYRIAREMRPNGVRVMLKSR